MKELTYELCLNIKKAMIPPLRNKKNTEATTTKINKMNTIL